MCVALDPLTKVVLSKHKAESPAVAWSCIVLYSLWRKAFFCPHNPCYALPDSEPAGSMLCLAIISSSCVSWEYQNSDTQYVGQPLHCIDFCRKRKGEPLTHPSLLQAWGQLRRLGRPELATPAVLSMPVSCMFWDFCYLWSFVYQLVWCVFLTYFRERDVFMLETLFNWNVAIYILPMLETAFVDAQDCSCSHWCPRQRQRQIGTRIRCHQLDRLQQILSLFSLFFHSGDSV